MRAEVGDELGVRGRHVGDADRAGVVMEIHGHSGTPPYLVRWEDSHESLFTPSSDTHVGASARCAAARWLSQVLAGTFRLRFRRCCVTSCGAVPSAFLGMAG